MKTMMFTSAVLCVAVLLGTDHAQGTSTCEECKLAVSASRELGKEITQNSCRREHDDEDDRDLCEALVDVASDITESIKSSEDICRDLGYCPDPPRGGSGRRNFMPDAREVVVGTTAIGIVTILGVFAHWLKQLQPLMVPVRQLSYVMGRKKRDISSIDRTEGMLPGILEEEEEYDQFRNMDATLDSAHDLSESLDTNMNEAEMKMMCDVCKLRKYLESSNTKLVDGVGTSEGMMLCRSLPKKRDQRKCMMDLRQIRETIGSIFGPVESCQFLSCVSE